MKKLAFSLAIWVLLLSPATAGIVYIEGPNDRGEGVLPPATGMTLDTLGLFFVDIYAEDMAGFTAFQATLQFLDEALADAAGSTIFVAYNHIIPEMGAPWGDKQITWNEAFLPEITEVLAGQTFGLMSAEREWLPFPDNKWGAYVDKSITDKTWLMTVGYWYTPGVEGDGTQTYSIDLEAATTVFGDTDAHALPYTVIPGSVTIGGSVTHSLTVQSTPITGVDITGDKPGTTNYTATCDDQEVVNLAAPPTVTVGAVRYDFVLWNVDGTDQPVGQADLQVTIDADVAATAVYEVQTHTLTVLSMPISGADVTGDKPGTTSYASACDDQQLVSITAAAAMGGGSGKGYNFIYWIVDDVPQPYGQAELQLTMDADHTAIAIYDWRLDGDSNDDCRVNVLDMLYVRNRLNGSRQE